MATFAERLKSLRREKGWSQQRLADELELSKSSVNMYERGEREPGFETMEAIADLFNVDMNYLYGRTDIKIADPIVLDHSAAPAPRPIPKGFEEMPEMVNLPVVGKIACGTPILAQQNIETYYQSPKEWRASMFLVCQGDSMEPFIKDGDMVAIREQQDAETDEIVAVMELDGCDGFATLKKLKKRPDRVELWPLNPEYEPIIYLKEEMNKLQIIGLAVGVIRRIHE